MGVALLILRVIISWQVGLSSVLFLVLYSLVSQLTAFEKRPRVVYYQPPPGPAGEQKPATKEKK